MTEPTKPKKWAKAVTIGSALIVAATPGVYSAWQSAKQAWEQRTEIRVRDAQEGDLQKAIKANAEAIRALKASMITHRDLVDLVLKLRADHHPQPVAIRVRPRARHNSAPARTSVALDGAIAKLRTKAAAGSKARQKATQALQSAPAFKPATQVRAIEQKKIAF